MLDRLDARAMRDDVVLESLAGCFRCPIDELERYDRKLWQPEKTARTRFNA